MIKQVQKMIGMGLAMLLMIGMQTSYAQDSEVLCDWEEGGTCWTWDFNSGSTAFATVDNPAADDINGSAQVQQFTTDPAEGFPFFLHDYAANGEPAVDLGEWPVYKLKVYSTVEGGSVLLKFENADNSEGLEMQQSVTAGVWQELIFEFAPTAATPLIKMVIFPNFLTQGTPTDGSWYFDDLIRSKAVDTASEDDLVPTTFALDQNYPNPFNPTTTIRYRTEQAGPVSLKVFNLLGVEVATLVDGFKPAGAYESTFEAGKLPSGVYLYQVTSGGKTQIRKMMLLK